MSGFLRILSGLFLLACGDAQGAARFGSTRQAYMSSLAPLLAFTLVGATLYASRAGWQDGCRVLLALLCNLLAPAVIAHALCRRFGREAEWARYATILNWAQWLFGAVLVLLILAAGALIGAGIDQRVVPPLVLTGLAVYVLWFEWFVTRAVLTLSRARAALAVLAIVAGGTLLSEFPAYAQLAWEAALKGSGT